MKKLSFIVILLSFIVTTCPLGDWNIFVDKAYCMSLESTEEVQIGLSKFKLPVFMEYDFSQTYAGFLLTIVDYANLFYGDIGLLSNKDNKFISTGVSVNLETLCGKIGLNYKLPVPLAIGTSFGRAWYQDKNIVVFYIALVGELDK